MAATDTHVRRASDLMQQSFTSLAAGDLEGLGRVWDDRSTADFIALDLELNGRAQLQAFFREVFAALPDLRFTIEAVHDVDERTAVGQWRLQGTFSGGPFQGIEPTGKRVDLRGIDVMRFEGSILRHNAVYYDSLSFARQVGLLPMADSAGDRAILAAFNLLTRIRAALRSLFRR